MGETYDPQIAAMKAGYKQPAVAANKLMKRPEVVEASREAATRFLMEKAGPIGVMVATRIALDTTLPANTQLKAAIELMKASGLYKSEANTQEGEDHELTAEQLRAKIARLERERAEKLGLLSNLAQVIEAMPNEPEPEPEMPADGTAFD